MKNINDEINDEVQRAAGADWLIFLARAQCD